MRNLKVAAVLILVYAVVLLANGLHYYSWSQDGSELPRMLIRVGGAGLIAFGLWRADRWAWWVGLVFSGGLAVVGLLALFAVLSTGLLEGRPNPTLDVVVLAVSSLVLCGAFLALLPRAAREAAGV